MRLSTIMEVINAAQNTRYVAGPFPQRGGIGLVAPPGHFKTALIEFLDEYPTAMVLSDLNNRTLIQIRDDILGGAIHTLAFEEFKKLYQRHSSVSANLEGHIQAFMDQGFRLASFEDPRGTAPAARCLIIAAMTPKFFRLKSEEWHDSGFYRRFLWCHYRLKDPNVIVDAIEEWKRLNLGRIAIVPISKEIPFSLTKDESKYLRHMLRFHKTFDTAFILLQKIACVLKWTYERQPDRPLEILLDFEECLSKDGGLVTI